MRPDTPTRVTLWVIVTSATLTVMAGAILGPVVPQIQTGVGVSGSLAGLVITTHAAFIVLTSPVAGILVDRFGPRRPFIAGLLLYAVGGGAGVAIDDFLPLLGSRAVLGVGVAFVYTGITVLIYDLYEGQQMDRVLGLRTGANSVGGAVWPLLGGALGTISWQFPFGVYLVALPLGLVAIATIPPTGRETGVGTPRPAASAADTEASTDGVSAIIEGFRRQPALLLVYLLYFGTNALLYAIVVFYPQLLDSVGITSSLWVGLYLTVNGVAGGVSGTLYEKLKLRVDAHHLVLVAFALWTIAFGIAATVRSAVGLGVPVALFGFGIGLVFPSAFVWIEALAPSALRGQFSSYLAMAGYIGQFVSPLLFGVFVSPFGIRGVFGTAALITSIAMAALGVAILTTRDESSGGSS